MKTLPNTILCLMAISTSLCVARAENVNGLISEQIASHFEQVFFPYSPSTNQDRDSWLPGNDTKPKLFDMDISLSTSATWIARTSIDKSDNDIDVYYTETSYSFSYPFKPGKKIGFVAKISDYFLDETGSEEFPVFDYDHASQIDLGLMYTMNINPRWDLFCGTGLMISDGNGALQSSSTNYLIFLGASWTINPDLTMAFGGIISTNPTFESGPFPQFMLEWRINDRSRLSIRDGFYYQYALTNDWRNVLGLSAECFCVSVEEKSQFINGMWRIKPVRIISDYSLNLTYSHWFRNGLILETKFGLGHLGNHSLWRNDDKFESRDLDYSVGLNVGLSYRF